MQKSVGDYTVSLYLYSARLYTTFRLKCNFPQRALLVGPSRLRWEPKNRHLPGRRDAAGAAVVVVAAGVVVVAAAVATVDWTTSTRQRFPTFDATDLDSCQAAEGSEIGIAPFKYDLKEPQAHPCYESLALALPVAHAVNVLEACVYEPVICSHKCC